MFRSKVPKEARRVIQGGNTEVLLKHLKIADREIIESLKNNKDDIRFLQGASHIIDELIKILEDA